MNKINFGDLAYILEDSQRLDEAVQDLAKGFDKIDKAIQKLKKDRVRVIEAFAKDVTMKLQRLVEYPNASDWKMIGGIEEQRTTGTYFITWENRKANDDFTLEIRPSDIWDTGKIWIEYDSEAWGIEPNSNAVVQHIASYVGGAPDG